MTRVTAMAFAIIVCSALLIAPPVVAQNNYDNVSIEATKLADNVYMLTGAGGNIGVFTAADGAIMVDAQFAPLKDKITAAIAKLTDKPVTTLINSHFHRDHTDGNAAFAAADVRVIAQQNVYNRLQANENFDRAGLPHITFSQQLAIQTQQGALQLEYYPGGHTDGDIITWFPGANVIHAGDLFFVDRFPFIDLNSGGTVDGYINNVSAVISKINDDTQIIPGHGSLSDKSDWQRLVDMIKATRAEVLAAKAQGLSEAEIIEQGLSDKWQDWSWNFITEKRWIETLYRDDDASAAR